MPILPLERRYVSALRLKQTALLTSAYAERVREVRHHELVNRRREEQHRSHRQRQAARHPPTAQNFTRSRLTEHRWLTGDTRLIIVAGSDTTRVHPHLRHVLPRQAAAASRQAPTGAASPELHPRFPHPDPRHPRRKVSQRRH